MDWHLAVEKNREALKRILAMLVAMTGLPVLDAGTGSSGGQVDWRAAPTLPRHLHRFVLRLLRPAEAAARRLIIVAARGLVVEVSPPRQRKPKLKSIFVRNGIGTGIVRRGSLPDRALAASRSAKPSLPLFDSLKRFGVRRRYVKQREVPQIRSFDDICVPLFRRPPAAQPPPQTPDDPLDAGRLSRRLEALASALDDLPRQAKRLARWRAHRLRRGAQVGNNDTGRSVQSASNGADGKARSNQRFSPMRPGRPPGWRCRPDHAVYEVLNELHGLAVWAQERPDTS